MKSGILTAVFLTTGFLTAVLLTTGFLTTVDPVDIQN